MPGEAPPQMIEIEAVGALAILLEKRSMMPNSSASGQGPRSSASVFEAASASLRICAKIFLFHPLAITPSSGMPLACRKEWKPHPPSTTERSREAEYLARPIEAGALSLKSFSPFDRKSVV